MTLRMIHETREPRLGPAPGADPLPEGPVLTRRVSLKDRFRRFKEWLLQWR